MMSNKYQTLFNRGKFFIETASPPVFKSWLNRNALLDKAPMHLIGRLFNLIEVGERDKAILFWMCICESIESKENIMKITVERVAVVIYLAVAVYITYIIINIVNS